MRLRRVDKRGRKIEVLCRGDIVELVDSPLLAAWDDGHYRCFRYADRGELALVLKRVDSRMAEIFAFDNDEQTVCVVPSASLRRTA